MEAIERHQYQTSQAESTVSLLDVTRVLVKHRWFIIAATLIGAVFIVIFALYTKMPNTSRWNVMPTQFTAIAQVRLLENPSSGLSQSGQSGGGASLASLLTGSSTPATTNAELALALLKGDTLANQVSKDMNFVQRFHIKRHPLTSAQDILHSNMKISYDSLNGIITIKFTNVDKYFAANVVNKIVDVLQQRFNALNLQQVNADATYLQGRVTTAQVDLQKAQNKLIAFMNKYGIVDLQSQSQAQTSQIASLNQQIQAKEIQLATLRHYGRTNNDPSVRQINTDISILQNLIAQLRTGSQGFNIMGGIPVDQLPRISAEYEQLRGDVATQQQVLGLVQSQYLTSKLQENAAMQTLQIVERAQPPELGSKPNRKVLAMVFTVAVFLIAVFIAFIREYFARARLDPVQAAKIAEIRSSLGRNHVAKN